MFFKIGALKIFAKSLENICIEVSLLKLQIYRPVALFKRDSRTGVFLWILHSFKSSFFTEHIRTTASGDAMHNFSL